MAVIIQMQTVSQKFKPANQLHIINNNKNNEEC